MSVSTRETTGSGCLEANRRKTELKELPLLVSAGSLCQGENRNSFPMCISVSVFQKMSFVKLCLQRHFISIKYWRKFLKANCLTSVSQNSRPSFMLRNCYANLYLLPTPHWS